MAFIVVWLAFIAALIAIVWYMGSEALAYFFLALLAVLVLATIGGWLADLTIMAMR